MLLYSLLTAFPGFALSVPGNETAPELVIPLFSPKNTAKEIRRVEAKYKNSEALLHGTNLNASLVIPMVTSWTSESEIIYSPNSELPIALMPLTNLAGGVEYFGPIDVGSPSQRMQVQVDTGSSELWFITDCETCSSSDQQFRSSSSSSFKPSGVDAGIDYGIGSISGTVAEDIATIANLTVPAQSFTAANDVTPEFDRTPPSGLIGMAFGTLSVSQKPTWFENLMLQRNVAAPQFGIYLTANAASGSSLCIGCVDASKFSGDFSWIPVVRRSYWTVEMNAFVVNEMSAGVTNLFAAIDTGTTYIYLPGPIADELYSKIPGAGPLDSFGAGYYGFPCDTTDLTIGFLLGTEQFALDPAAFNLGRTKAGSDQCVGGILGLSSTLPSDLAILGVEFLHSYYSVYDYSHGARVGLAKLNSLFSGDGPLPAIPSLP